MSCLILTAEVAARFATIALGHVGREYPHKLDHVLTGEADVQGPRALHPIFYGSFDWHSCVHGYWLLARLRRRFPGAPFVKLVDSRFAEVFTADKVEGELAYLARPASGGFERPYGWAWLLALAAELRRQTDFEGQAWSETLKPLGAAFADRFKAFLPKADYPVRGGAHGNTAFALLLALDYAATADAVLAEQIRAKALAWYVQDAHAPGSEPSGHDFLSPTLIEAQLMSRVLPPVEFAGWLARFLPRLAERQPAALFSPASVSDRTDGAIAHLDGLNLSRAWAWRALAELLDAEAAAVANTAADLHLDAALPHVAGDYMGEHWLATYALLALDGGF